jgi:hypothetical protein
MRNHLKPFAVELRFFNEQIQDRRLDIKIYYFFPPRASNKIVFCREEEFGVGTGAVRGATQTSINDFLGFDLRVFVGDILETQIRRFVFDGKRRWWWNGEGIGDRRGRVSENRNDWRGVRVGVSVGEDDGIGRSCG